MTPIMKARHQAVKRRSVKDDGRRKTRWYLVPPLTVKLMRQVICHRVLNDNLFNLVKLACSLLRSERSLAPERWARSYQRFSFSPQAAPWSGLVNYLPPSCPINFKSSVLWINQTLQLSTEWCLWLQGPPRWHIPMGRGASEAFGNTSSAVEQW